MSGGIDVFTDQRFKTLLNSAVAVLNTSIDEINTALVEKQERVWFTSGTQLAAHTFVSVPQTIIVETAYDGGYRFVSPYKKVAAVPAHLGYLTDANGNIFEYDDAKIHIIPQIRAAHLDDIAKAIQVALDIWIARNRTGTIVLDSHPDGNRWTVKSQASATGAGGRLVIEGEEFFYELDAAFGIDGALLGERWLTLSGAPATALDINAAYPSYFKLNTPVDAKQGSRVGIWDPIDANGWDFSSGAVPNHRPGTYTRSSRSDDLGKFNFKKDIDYDVAVTGGAGGELDTTNISAQVWLDDLHCTIYGLDADAELLDVGQIPGTFKETIPVANISTANNTFTLVGTYANGQEFMVSSDAVLLTSVPQIQVDTTYFVVETVDGHTFKLSTTAGGAAIDITAVGTGNLSFRTAVGGQSAGGASATGVELYDGVFVWHRGKSHGIRDYVFIHDADFTDIDCSFCGTYNGSAVIQQGWGVTRSIRPQHHELRHYTVGDRFGPGTAEVYLSDGAISSQKEAFNSELYPGENSCPLDMHGGGKIAHATNMEIDGGVNLSNGEYRLNNCNIICGRVNGAFLVRTDGKIVDLKMNKGKITIPRYRPQFDDGGGSGNFSTQSPFRIILHQDTYALSGWKAVFEDIEIEVADPDSWTANSDLYFDFGGAVWERIGFVGGLFKLRGTSFRRVIINVRGSATTVVDINGLEIDGASLTFMLPQVADINLQVARTFTMKNSKIRNNDPTTSYPIALDIQGDTGVTSVFEGPNISENVIEHSYTTDIVRVGATPMMYNIIRNNDLRFTGVAASAVAAAMDVSRNVNSTFTDFLSDLSNNVFRDSTGNIITAGVILRNHNAAGALPVAKYDISNTKGLGVTTGLNLTGTELKPFNYNPEGVGSLLSTLAADFVGTNVATAQPIFSAAQDTFTLEANTLYEVVGKVDFSRAAGVTSHTTAVKFGGTATFTDFAIDVAAANSAGGTLSAQQQLTVDNTGGVVTAANTDATEVVRLKLLGHIRTNAAGTFIPQIQYSAAPGGVPTFKKDSFIKLRKIGASSLVTAGLVA